MSNSFLWGKYHTWHIEPCVSWKSIFSDLVTLAFVLHYEGGLLKIEIRRIGEFEPFNINCFWNKSQIFCKCPPFEPLNNSNLPFLSRKNSISHILKTKLVHEYNFPPKIYIKYNFVLWNLRLICHLCQKKKTKKFLFA